MTPTLYHFSGAPRSWRVLLAFAFKGLKLEHQLLSYANGDHRTETFLELNPRGTTPVLTIGTTKLRDSIAILAWLDHAYPETPLFGATPDEAAEIWQIAMECTEFLREASHVLLLQAFASNGKPPSQGSPEHATLQTGAELMHAECRYLEKLLSDGRPFLAGDAPTAADAIAYPEIRLMERAVTTKHELMAGIGFGDPPALYPLTAAWKARLSAMPEVAATLPEHWNVGQEAA
ncbi:glutathione S-transferase [Aliiroseovarius halocynthiae]|uniref:Glutathione S-transferase family protein n=1 Tax=Aliiroseovarius halocynthiae TaxID=985055 RepID=A0A545SQV4_9RHOB|nr:glutathione S-transferase family protein [Aliiroseovarius halocynthiae]TQV67353.1 glutathione S-transferase family protein [Aliiroseovarius halocynthiae]SMR81243.1 glutathione S-transferase [Aliiroseovarius halocynthiae]